MDSQSQSWDSGGTHQFPAGLRVLVVDDDATCLKIIDRMLKKCQYTVTTCSRAVVALEILRENKEGFDIVLSDVHMPDMDGFKLLVHIGLEMDLPVIMMSADDGKDVVMKGVAHGACDYLIKPVSMKALMNIWQHVFRKKRNELKDLDYSGSLDDSDKQKKPLDEGDSASSGSWKAAKRKKVGEEEDEVEEREDSSTLKKSRVVWSVDLHQQFVAAVNQLGLEKAVPKKILELMNDPTLTRENVASHLQKYRQYLKRLSVPQHQGRADTSFASSPDASINQVSSFDLQALAASGQISPQALMTLYPVSRRVANISMGMPNLDQRGFFNSEAGPTIVHKLNNNQMPIVHKLNNNQMPLHPVPTLATNVSMGMTASDQRVFFNSDAQLANSSYIRPPIMQQMNNNQMNVFYKSSTSMEPRHIEQAQMFQLSDGNEEFMSLPSSLRTNSPFPSSSSGYLTNPFVTQMNQQGRQISLGQQQGLIQSGVQQQPQSRGQLLSGISDGKQIVSEGVTNHVLVRNGIEVNGGASLQGNFMTMSQCGTVPQSLYSNDQNGNMSKSNCHTHVNSIQVAPGGLATLDNVVGLTCDMFSDFYQRKNEGWNLQNRNHSYEIKQSNVDYDFSLKAHHDSNTILEEGTTINSCTVGKEISTGPEIKHETVEYISQDLLFSDDSFPNELMSVFKR